MTVIGDARVKIDAIIEKLSAVIDFVIDKNLPDFSLDKFKLDYAYYSKDLCDVTEQGFIDYLFVFFQDKGRPALATTNTTGKCTTAPIFISVSQSWISLSKRISRIQAKGGIFSISSVCSMLRGIYKCKYGSKQHHNLIIFNSLDFYFYAKNG